MYTVRLSDRDNVAIAKTDLRSGMMLPEAGGMAVRGAVPQFHKLAVQRIGEGSPIIKYGQVIGVASTDISMGEHVHVHNCVMTNLRGDRSDESPVEFTVPTVRSEHFMGFHRGDGQVGTRNYIGIITTVNCSAFVAKAIERHFESVLPRAEYPNVDGVIAITHGSGCGMSKGEGFKLLERVCSGMAVHPNFASVLLIGLGCEVMQLESLMTKLPPSVAERSLAYTIQASGGTKAAIKRGIEHIEALLPEVNALERTPAHVSALKVGLQCGGSDALSGITANPALGRAMDILASLGGTAILSETPELYGAEQLLLDRAISSDVSARLMERLSWWQNYTQINGAELNNNPSPGNKAGGLTTILEKSLGAQAKGGNSPLMGVYEYAEPIRDSGLVVMDSPGYDPVSVTGQMASGANVICFTTGRGSVYGSRPAPSLKFATNTPLAQSMSDDMDYNCGRIFDGELSLDDAAVEMYELILATASGDKTRSERQGYGALEFLPWPIGAVL